MTLLITTESWKVKTELLILFVSVISLNIAFVISWYFCCKLHYTDDSTTQLWFLNWDMKYRKLNKKGSFCENFKAWWDNLWYNWTRDPKYMTSYNWFMLYQDNANTVMGILYFIYPGFGTNLLLTLGIIAFVVPFLWIAGKSFLSKDARTGGRSCGFKWMYFFAHVTNTAEFQFKRDQGTYKKNNGESVEIGDESKDSSAPDNKLQSQDS
jgi:ABC-type glycerol-3-phosphate transport system permease component